MRKQRLISQVKRRKDLIFGVIVLAILLIIGWVVVATPMSWIKLTIQGGVRYASITIDHGEEEYVYMDGVYEHIYKVWPGTHSVVVKFGGGTNPPTYWKMVKTALFETEKVEIP